MLTRTEMTWKTTTMNNWKGWKGKKIASSCENEVQQALTS